MTYFVRNLHWHNEDPEEFETQDEAEKHAINRSWSDDAYGIYEGDDWENAELTSIAFAQRLFT